MSAVTRSPTRLTARVAAKRLRRFTGSAGLWDLYFVSAIVVGLLLQAIFDAIVDDRGASHLALLIVVYALVELTRRLIVHHGAISWVSVWTMMEMFLRGGMLRGQLASGGSHAARSFPHAGAAMARFRDDARDVAWYADSWIDVAGAAAFTTVAVALMARIDPWLTVFSILPIFGVALTTRLIGAWVARAHRRHLEAASRLTAVLRDAFAAHDTIRLYDARDGVVGEVGRRARARGRAAVVDRILTESVRAASNSLSGVAVGVLLLLVADDLQRGDFSVGDLALFTSYLRTMTFLPRMVGHFLTRQKQAGVAFDRMGEMAAGGEPARLLDELDLDIDRSTTTPAPPAPARVPLRRLEVRGLRSVYPGGAGLLGADLTLDAGTLTVITGPVGSGKTTLVRALVGLEPATGRVTWNGAVIDDLAAFMVPPQAAYLPQTPRLFSDTMQDNIELGYDGLGAQPALEMARLTAEVDAMHAGTATMVGPRGIRLSGGQRQRVALARALHRQPELLVLDDLSSAVDADTEIALWRELRASGTTILAISNRPIAIEGADQVLTMVDGRLVRADGDPAK